MATWRQHTVPEEIPGTDAGSPEQLLVQRILASHCLEKSARMREVLAYVCDRTLHDPHAEIREQDIGCAVFGRPSDYDTNQDNIVRVNASQLRRKLETYFKSEGGAEPLILELPRGQYRPIFHPRGNRVPEPRSFQPRGTVRLLACLSGVLALICAGLTWALVAHRADEPGGPNVHALWSHFLKSGETTDIVLSDSSLGLMQDLTGKPVSLAEYVHPDIWRLAPSLASRPDAQLAARLSARRRHTDMASVNSAKQILALAGPHSSRLSLWFARDFSLRQMKSDNIVLLGSRRTNPWVEIVEKRLHFRFAFDPATRQGSFSNPQPAAGELPAYANDPVTSYCQIGYLPNPSGNGNLLVISGTDVQGTEAGTEFVAGEAGLANLRKRLPRARSGQFPYFEAILKATRIGGTVPDCEIAAARPID